MNYKNWLLYRLLRTIYHWILRTWKSFISMFTDKFSREFICKQDVRLVYLNNPKVACSSIKVSMFGDFEYIHRYVQNNNYETKSLSPEMRSYYKFTFVRNPYVRLVSCYEDKIVKNKDHFPQYYHIDMQGITNFDDFIKRIIKISYYEADPHFASQYRLTHNKWGKCLVDYVGKFENLKNDYEPIRIRFGLNPLPHRNKVASLLGKNWMDYYTLETAELVYKKYKKDFTAFGYKDECRKLKEYLKQKV